MIWFFSYFQTLSAFETIDSTIMILIKTRDIKSIKRNSVY